MALGMIFQTMYYFVDLYFVGRLGDTAIAGVSAAGNVQFIVLALTQVLGVGTTALIAQAIGRKDTDDASLVFNQSTSLAFVCAVVTLVLGYGFAASYLGVIGADAATQAAGVRYLFWYLPGLALQFALISMGSALRGAGVVKPGMLVQMMTVVLNAILAPILIAGWGTGRPMGVAGAGLSTSIAIAIGVAVMLFYFRNDHRVRFNASMLRVRRDVWARILKIGLPSGGEFLLMFAFMGVIYYVIRDFGAPAQAGYGVGSRVMQGVFLPAMAISFATAPLAGQNFGAGRGDRVRETFRSAAIIGSIVMLIPTLLCQWNPDLLIRMFAKDPAVVSVGADFLRMISWNFVASGLIFTCSGMFQALGNTIPSLISGAVRLATFGLPAIWLSRQPGFTMQQVWWLGVITVMLQMAFSVWLLRRELNLRFPVGSDVARVTPPLVADAASD